MRELQTVLIVDDNRISRMMLREIVEDLGVTVLEAKDGDQAMALIRSEKPDLVISDLLMPGCDGFALSSQIREAGLCPPMVLFLISAVYKSGEWRYEAVTKYGAQEFLAKPISIDDIEQAIRRHFTLAATTPAAPQPEESIPSEPPAQQAPGSPPVAFSQPAAPPSPSSPEPPFPPEPGAMPAAEPAAQPEAPRQAKKPARDADDLVSEALKDLGL